MEGITFTTGKYRKFTAKKQEEEYLSNHPLAKRPLGREKLKEPAGKYRPVTWYHKPLSLSNNNPEFLRQISEDFSAPSCSKTNLRKSKLTASEPFLSSIVAEDSEGKTKSPSKFFSFNFVKFREKTYKRSISTSAQNSSSEKTSKSSAFLPSIMKQRNSDSSNPAPLLDALDNKKIRTAFFDFLASEYSSENLCFWLSCEKFRKMKNDDERFKEGQDIYTQYISNNSPLQINIDHVTRRQITIAMTCGDDVVPIDVFARAQGKVFSIMENDAYPRFVVSKYYKDAQTSKKNTLESVFSTILPGSISPTMPWNKNMNNNNTKDHLAVDEDKNAHRRFSFGFKKANKSKEIAPVFNDANFYGVAVKIA